MVVSFLWFHYKLSLFLCLILKFMLCRICRSYEFFFNVFNHFQKFNSYFSEYHSLFILWTSNKNYLLFMAVKYSLLKITLRALLPNCSLYIQLYFCIIFSVVLQESNFMNFQIRDKTCPILVAKSEKQCASSLKGSCESPCWILKKKKSQLFHKFFFYDSLISSVLSLSFI